jgi:hypothetical protein
MNYKLDDIDKKQSFKVPEGYFEDLPLKIQSKIQKKEIHSNVLLPSWKFALAASILVILVTYFIADQKPPSAEMLLAEVSQEDLIAYLDNIDLDIEDLTSTFQESTEELDFENLDGLDQLDMNEEELDDLLLEYDITEDYL